MSSPSATSSDPSYDPQIEAAARAADELRDSLTGLPGPVLLCDRIRHALHRRMRSRSVFALISLSLNDYSSTLAELGQEALDELVVFLAHSLEPRLRPNDSISWSGRGEFLILLDDVRSASDLVQICERISGTFQSPALVQGRTVTIFVSLGVALLTDQCSGPTDVIANARSAMLRARRDEVNGPVFFDVFPPGAALSEP